MKKIICIISGICLSLLIGFAFGRNINLHTNMDVVLSQTGESKKHIETERKFLIDPDNLPDNMEFRSDTLHFIQTYINYKPEMRVRQVNHSEYYFTMKRPEDNIGLSREETEIKISSDEYKELLKKQTGNTIYKTRYQFLEGNYYIAVDVYSRWLEGLVVAEVEFSSTADAEQYTPPEWFGKDVTSDKRYKNAILSQKGIPENK